MLTLQVAQHQRIATDAAGVSHRRCILCAFRVGLFELDGRIGCADGGWTGRRLRRFLVRSYGRRRLGYRIEPGRGIPPGHAWAAGMAGRSPRQKGRVRRRLPERSAVVRVRRPGKGAAGQDVRRPRGSQFGATISAFRLWRSISSTAQQGESKNPSVSKIRPSQLVCSHIS